MRHRRRTKSTLSQHALQADLIAMIQAERRLKGQVFPSIRAIAADYSVSRATAGRAVRALIEQGLCRAERGRGVFLAVDGAELETTKTVATVFGHEEYARETNLFCREVYEGFQDWLFESGHNVLKLHKWYEKSPARQAREWARLKGQLSGVAVFEVYEDQYCLALRDCGLPLVVLDYDTEALGIDCAILDCFGSTRRLAARVLGAGAGEVFLVDFVPTGTGDPAHLERRRGLEAALAAAGRGGKPDAVVELNSAGEEEQFRQVVSRLASAPRKPGAGREAAGPAVLCYDYSVVAGVVERLAAAGLAPGRDFILAYAGPSRRPEDLAGFPALVAAFDFHQLGRAGGELLARRMEGGRGRARKLVLGEELSEYRPAAEAAAKLGGK